MSGTNDDPIDRKSQALRPYPYDGMLRTTGARGQVSAFLPCDLHSYHPGKKCFGSLSAASQQAGRLDH
jgi:hypothetical protein